MNALTLTNEEVQGRRALEYLRRENSFEDIQKSCRAFGHDNRSCAHCDSRQDGIDEYRAQGLAFVAIGAVDTPKVETEGEKEWGDRVGRCAVRLLNDSINSKERQENIKLIFRQEGFGPKEIK